MLLVAFMATGSTTAASDTLWIKSMQQIDMCSGERKFLIAAWMGQVYFSDSLQSFDITIGYDTSRFTPTDGLISGTLAEYMKFSDISPFFNFRLPGEMRVGGFTINSNVAGDKPLFAITGNYKGACTDTGTFTMPWPASFNEEFKGEVKFFRSDTISVVATARPVDTIGIACEADTVVIPGVDSVRVVTMQLKQRLLVGRPLKVHLELEREGVVAIDDVEGEVIDSMRLASNGTTAEIWLTGQAENSNVNVTMRSVSDAKDTMVVLTMRMEDEGECQCIVPRLKDSIDIISRTTTSDVKDVGVYESTAIQLEYTDGVLRMQCLHGQPWRVQVANVLGMVISETMVEQGELKELQLADGQTGMLFVQATDGKQQVTRTLIK